MITKLSVAVCWLLVAVSGDKWVWGNNHGRDGLRGEHSIARPYVNTNTESSSASSPLFRAVGKKQKLLQSPQSDDPGDERYEVYENGNGPGGPNDLPSRPPINLPTQYPGPNRPPTQYQGPNRPPTQFPGPDRPPTQYPGPDRPPTQYPGPNRPPTQYPGPRPGQSGTFGPSPLPPLPPGSSGPPPPRPPGRPEAQLGVLTGPVPSWERPLPPKNNDPTAFDSCKCVNSFNCKSPGLKFGSCDVGKFYCCYNNAGYGIQPSGAPPSFGNKSPGGPAVLAGPNGPVDGLRPDFLSHLGPPFLDGPEFNRPPPPPGLAPLPFDDFQPRSNSRDKSKDRRA